MPRPPKGTPHFPTVTDWYGIYPDGYRNPSESFTAIPMTLHNKLSKAIVHEGDTALQTWRTVSEQLNRYQDEQAAGAAGTSATDYFARIGYFTTLCAIFEDRVNSLFWYRCKMVYGKHFPAKMKFIEIFRKAIFLHDYDDIDTNTLQAIETYGRWRNSIVHQAHYHNEILQPVVMNAIQTLYQVMVRMRGRQRTVLQKEDQLHKKGAHAQRIVDVVQHHATGLIQHTALHHQVGGGCVNLLPFRQGQPLYAVVNNVNNVHLDDAHVGIHEVWFALHNQNAVWHDIPIFRNTGQGVRYVAQKTLKLDRVTPKKVTFVAV
ncbi:MAG: hypothetical protein EBS29_01990 [Chloroflexia bacterium]|nr:hypothetical protein [Chloroflexia bacterium]